MSLSVVFFTALFCACRPAPPARRELPDFSLTAVTVDGTVPLDKRALLGRVWIADFVFTRCAGPCPLLSASMAGLQKRLPPSVGLLSFTVDPDNDGPEALAVYAGRYAADPRRWLFVTGGKAELVRLIRDGFLLPVAEDAAAAPGQRVSHSTKLVLLDSRARVRGWYDGDDPASIARLEADAKSL